MLDKDSKEIQSSGGKARAAKMTPEERSESARKAVLARWLKATHQGVLRLGEAEIPCYVLDDGRRVLSRNQMVAALGMSKGSNPEHGGDRLSNFVAGKLIKPFISDDLRVVTDSPIRFRIGEVQAFGYEALALGQLCSAIIEAERHGVLQTQQERIAERAWSLMKGFGLVGIIALVDEATGYQYDRARDELQKILAAYIAEELRPWVRRFPHEFFKQVYRLHGWRYEPGQVHGPSYIGKFINRVVYEQLPAPVLPEIKRLNPPNENGQRKHKHFQFLTEETGEPTLDRQIAMATVLMKAARDKAEFWRLFSNAYPKTGSQLDNGLALESGDTK